MKRLFFYLIISTIFISCNNTNEPYEVSKRQSKEFKKLFDSYFLLRNNNIYDNNNIKQLNELLYIYKFPNISYQYLSDPTLSIHKINFTNWKIETISEIFIKNSQKYCLIGYSANGFVKINKKLGSIQKHIESIKFSYNLNIDFSVDSIEGNINCTIKDSLYLIQPYKYKNWYIYEELINIEDNDLEIISPEVIDYLEYKITDKMKLSPDQSLDIGTMYYKRGYYKAALEYFKKYYETGRMNPELLYRLGNCNSKTQNFELSNKYFEMSLEFGYRQSDCYYHLAKNKVNSEMSEESFNTALNYINKAIELNPQDYGYYGYKGELYLMIGDKINACICFNEAIEKGGNEYTLYIEKYCLNKEV